ncbi:MAG: hypothetical protein Q7R40_00220 [Phaeospirillum sp.]|nr:hypothetical protein [Phaeospirillum sp.]
MTTSISWPSRLPLPTFEGYGIEPQDAVSRTDMEAGAARQRRRFTAVPTRIPVRWRFSANEFALFEAWFHWMAEDAAGWFAISLLGGIGMVAHEARFLGGSSPYKAQPRRGGRDGGVTWITTAVLEVRQRPVMSGDVLQLVFEEDPAALMAAVARAHDVIHFVLPGTDISGLRRAADGLHSAVQSVLSDLRPRS